jgi:hypothetical protein
MLAAVRGRGAIALALLMLVGCAGQTNRPTIVGTSAATLNGVRQCVSDVDGRWAWQWREVGTQSWSSGGASQLNCPGGGGPLSHKLSGLKPDTSYQYRLLVDPKEPCNLGVPATCHDVYPLDANGVANGTTYDTFTTQPQCDDVQGASESLAAFVASNPAGTSGDRRVLCLRAGAQSIGQLNGLKAWSTLTPRGEADGTKQAVMLIGNLGLGNRGTTVEDVQIVGCYAQSGCAADRDKTVDVRASDVTLRHLDITQQGGRNRDVVQCVLIDGGSQPTNVSLQHSKVHSCGSESSGNMEHGLYCSSALRPLIAGNWFYDNEGFGIQLYPNCDGALVIGNVVAENGGACDVDGSSTSAAYVSGFCGFSRENVSRSVFPPIHCGTTSSSQAIDMVLYDPRGGTTDCGGVKLASKGTLNADPQFANRAGYDFRMGNPFARAKLGIYAEIPPGPRW